MVPCGSCCYQLKLPMITKCLTHSLFTPFIIKVNCKCRYQKKTQIGMSKRSTTTDNEPEKKSWQRLTLSEFVRFRKKPVVYQQCQRRRSFFAQQIFLLRNDSAQYWFWQLLKKASKSPFGETEDVVDILDYFFFVNLEAYRFLNINDPLLSV